MDGDRPHIIILSLVGHFPFSPGNNGSPWRHLCARATVTEVDTTARASTLFGQLVDRGIKPVTIATDATVAAPEWTALRINLVAFVQAGDTLVFALNTSRSASAAVLDSLFEEPGLRWRAGTRRRRVYGRNFAMEGLDPRLLPRLYEVDALQLAGVRRHEVLYLPGGYGDARDPAIVPMFNLTPAAFGMSGKGTVGYVGDLYDEDVTDQVVLAICGLSG